MTWSKQPPSQTPRVNNEDLTATLYFDQPPLLYDAEGVPIPTERKLRFDLIIQNEDGTSGKGTADVEATLTAGTLASFRAALLKLRDAALADAGYIEK